jgi:hypothetical protein
MKGVRSGVISGSGSISQSYGSSDPDPHQNVTDPQRCISYEIYALPLAVIDARTYILTF